MVIIVSFLKGERENSGSLIFLERNCILEELLFTFFPTKITEGSFGSCFSPI